ncbi:ABC transporter A family member 2 [Linum perenne]
MNSSVDYTTAYSTIRNPATAVSPAIPPCEDKFFIRTPCFDFLWSGNDSVSIARIVRAIMANNPGRPISDVKVKSFRSTEEVDAWLLANPSHSPGALHFTQVSNATIRYGIQTNSSAVPKRCRTEDPTFKFQISLQIAAEREIARFVIGDPNFRWTVGLTEYAHPADEFFSSLVAVGPAFFLAFAMFGFVLQITALVTEKELKLRQIVTLFGFPYDLDTSKALRNFWSMFPPNLLALAARQLADATSTPEDTGITWSSRTDFVTRQDASACAMTILPGSICSLQNNVYTWLLGTFAVWILLAIYFDNIFPNAYGVRKPLVYFLNPGYWTGKGGNKVKEGGICNCQGSIPQEEHISPDDEDVLEEETMVKKDATEATMDVDVAVQIRGLAKTYAGTRKIGCCKCQKTSPYHAVG